jgi:DNA invertase Pin-like site-specific DNA recombinase
VTKCFIYLRVSGKSQVRGDGFRRQFIACRKYAAENGLQIVRIFKERGVSGTKELDDRPALSALFAALEENGVKTILIEKLDRLGRDLMVSETIVADIKKSGYNLVSTCEPNLISDDPSRNFIRVIFSAIAQLEKELLVLKLRGARQRKKIREGKCEGRKSFGHHPEEQSTLTQILDWRAIGWTCTTIAETLNERGYKSRSGVAWRASVISKILRRNRCA